MAEKNLSKTLFVLAAGTFSVLYLLNPLAGLDFIPDIIPGLGNLDEAAATTLLLACLAYFGLDLTKFLKNNEKPLDAKHDVVDVEAQVVNQSK